MAPAWVFVPLQALAQVFHSRTLGVWKKGKLLINGSGVFCLSKFIHFNRIRENLFAGENCLNCNSLIFEPASDKTNKMTCAPGEDSDQPGHPPSLIRVFAVRMKKHWALNYRLSAQWRLIILGECPGWSEICWAHMSFCCFFHVAARFIYCNHQLYSSIVFIYCVDGTSTEEEDQQNVLATDPAKDDTDGG